MALVWGAGVQWDEVTGTDRHLASRLARYGPVLWVDPPLSVVHALRTRTLRRALGPQRLQRVGAGITRLTVLVPPYPQRRVSLVVTRRLVRRAVRRAVRDEGLVIGTHIVTSPRHSLGDLQDVRRVYYATDDFVSGAGLMRSDARAMDRRERARLREADIVLAVSPEILDRWGLAGKVSGVLPNGCDPSHYAEVDRAALPAEVTLPSPIAGVVGQLSARIDLGILESLADLGRSVLLVGPVDPGFEPERFRALCDRPTVQWVGPKPFEALPSYLRLIDVGLTPYLDTAFNRASFPLKTLEYLAAGRAVVSTRLPATDRLSTDLIASAGSPDEFVALTIRALATPRTADDVSRRRAFAALHSWDRRAQELVTLVGLPAVVIPAEH